MVELDVVIENGVPQGVVVGQQGRAELHLGVVIRVASNLITENHRGKILITRGIKYLSIRRQERQEFR